MTQTYNLHAKGKSRQRGEPSRRDGAASRQTLIMQIFGRVSRAAVRESARKIIADGAAGARVVRLRAVPFPGDEDLGFEAVADPLARNIPSRLKSPAECVVALAPQSADAKLFIARTYIALSLSAGDPHPP